MREKKENKKEEMAVILRKRGEKMGGRGPKGKREKSEREKKKSRSGRERWRSFFLWGGGKREKKENIKGDRETGEKMFVEDSWRRKRKREERGKIIYIKI